VYTSQRDIPRGFNRQLDVDASIRGEIRLRRVARSFQYKNSFLYSDGVHTCAACVTVRMYHIPPYKVLNLDTAPENFKQETTINKNPNYGS